MDIAYLDGQYLPLAEARVPVLDRGYLFADGVYEVIPVYQGHIFELDAHLDRLDVSLGAIHLHNPMARPDWHVALNTVVERNGGGDLMLYLQVTRGVQPKRSFVIPEKPRPCVLAFCQPLPPVTDTIRQQGVSALTRPDIRWLNCHIKSTALLAGVLLSHEAQQSGCNEVILLRNGQLTEGGSSNVFIVRQGTVITPPKNHLILAGITRDVLLELLHANNVPCEERAVAEAELRAADEIWVTSSTREIYPVTLLDNQPVGNGKPGPLWSQAFQLFQTRKSSAA